jgi:AAA+ ATPase superfamily predicted ATPase
MSLNYLKMSKSADFIGREEELSRLKSIFDAKESSITVLYGRRRVGKTALIEAAVTRQ